MLSIKEVIEELKLYTYKPRTTFTIYWQRGELHFQIVAMVPDADAERVAQYRDNFGALSTTTSYDQTPDVIEVLLAQRVPPFSHRSQIRDWVTAFVEQFERHEIAEWLVRRGTRVTDPHPELTQEDGKQSTLVRYDDQSGRRSGIHLGADGQASGIVDFIP